MPAVVPTHVQRAIVEARARDEKPSVVMSKMKVGTLPGLEGRPFPIKQRTFYNYWDRAKAELRSAGAPKGQDGPSLLDRIGLEITIRRHGGDPADSPEAIAELTGLDISFVRACREAQAEAELAVAHAAALGEERRRREVARRPAPS